ncbi:proline-rich protein 11-like [Asterias amurensis]|uniref:proline-rich protein 11-like n=1 Tax=Asterias amurensis TaxID=7602 RepID=UPI003AB8D262
MARSQRRRRLYFKKHRRRRHHPYHPRNCNLEGQQQLNSSSDSMMDCTSDHDDGTTLSPLPLLSIDITTWLPLPEVSLLGPLRWCTDRVNQSLDWMKDTIFPSRVYHRELKETKEQLLLLQGQIEQLKAHTIKARKVDPTVNVIVKCNCQQSLPLPASSTTPRPIQHSERLITNLSPVMTSSSNMKAVTRTTSNCLPAVPPLPLPPAPLPPPPPPPPPISQPQKKLVFKKKKTDKILDEGNKINQRAMVTLSDIMNVKLKKVSEDNPKTKSGSSVIQLADIKNVQLKKTFREKKVVSGGQCIVSNDDLTAVKLRKRHVSQLLHDENANPMVLRSRISHEAVQFRKSLRKVVSVTRSPGGTPMKRGQPESHGTGLTPLMTNALRRKFKTVRSPSLSPKALSTFSPN